MKGIKIFFFLVLIAIFSRPICADGIDLGAFKNGEQEFLEKLPEKIKFEIGDSPYELTRQEISGWLLESSRLGYNSGYKSEIENIDFCPQNWGFCELTFLYYGRPNFQKVTYLSINENTLLKYAKDLGRTANKDPQNAKLKMEGGKVGTFALSQNGIKLNEEESVKKIADWFSGRNFSESINLIYETIKPEISTDSIDNLGITSLIGEGRSNFAGSPKNRIFNIKVATNRFDGALIKPGEEFSFVKLLGEVDGEHGYLPELVIKKDKTEPEFGGGICQVSTTAFRAAINSGLEITARRNHAYPVSYYNPQGMDATVYVPRPDLRFINDTPGYILVQTQIQGNNLIFEFYGTGDGRKVNIIGPKILEHKPDGSMKATFTQQILDRDGKIIREDIFNSNYDSPSKYPHPDTAGSLNKKPSGWSDKEWVAYKKANP